MIPFRFRLNVNARLVIILPPISNIVRNVERIVLNAARNNAINVWILISSSLKSDSIPVNVRLGTSRMLMVYVCKGMAAI